MRNPIAKNMPKFNRNRIIPDKRRKPPRHKGNLDA